MTVDRKCLSLAGEATVLRAYATVFLAYREHRGGEETPCEELQEDDDHSMVNTGLTDSLRLNACRKTDR